MVSWLIQILKIYGTIIQFYISPSMVGLQYHTSYLCKNKEKFVTLLFWTRTILANMGSLQAVIVTEYNIKSPGWCYLDIKEKMKSSYV